MMTKIQIYQAELSGWTIVSVIEQNINISKCKTLGGSGYIKQLNELYQSRKGSNNIQNSDAGKFLKWCLVRYLSPEDLHPARITKIDKPYARKPDFNDIKW